MKQWLTSFDKCQGGGDADPTSEFIVAPSPLQRTALVWPVRATKGAISSTQEAQRLVRRNMDLRNEMNEPEENARVMVVVPASRVPSPEMIEFWKALGKFDGVDGVKFVANGEKRQDISLKLEENFGADADYEILSQKAGSAPRARNAGLKRVKTRFVHFLDDDDQVRPDFYSEAIAGMQDDNLVGVGVSADVFIDGNPEDSYRVVRPDRAIGLDSLLVDNLLGPTSGVLLKTEAVKSVGGFDADMPARQDYDLWLRMAQMGDFRLLAKPLMIWTENRRRPSIRNSTSVDRHRRAIEKLMERKRALGFLELSVRRRRQTVANHYKYLAVMSQLSDGRRAWRYIILSIAAYPQPKAILMLFPDGFSRVARKVLANVRQKKLGRAQYGNVERRLAVALAKFPQIKRALKYVYQGTFYLLNSRKRSAVNIVSGELTAISVPGRESAESFFGYYDRNPENQNGHLAVHTLESGRCRINVIDGDGSLIESIPTRAWNYQQGALPFWADDDTLIFNDSNEGRIETVIHVLSTAERRYLEGSFQTYSHRNGRLASININLINKLRPEYGFKGSDPLFESDNQLLAFRSLEAPEVGVSYVTVADMAEVTGLPLPVGKTKINHVVFSPDGHRVTYLLRYFKGQMKRTFQIIHDFSKGTFHVVKCGNVVSHYCWVDNETIAIWGEKSYGERGYFLSNAVGEVSAIGADNAGFSKGDGHPTPVPGSPYLISDTYPDKAGMSHLYQFSWHSGSETELASFHQPFRFRGAKRIDMHPRYSETTGSVFLDSGHGGKRGAYRLKLASDCTLR